MNTVEEDAAHVRAVTAALSAPQVVWVLKCENKKGFGVAVYATERSARDCLLATLDSEWATTFGLDKTQYERVRIEVDNGSENMLDSGDADWYHIDSYEVSP